jgi:crotonobetainyl-CoA:carnitine CoA-transferase CaiB-like acyl-CoA transferase
MALLDTQVSVLANQALNWMVSGKVPQQLGNAHPNLAPYQTFAASNGDLIIAVGNDAQFGKLCEVLNLPLAADPRFATNPARVAHREQLAAIVGQAVAGWAKGALSDALEAVGVPAGPINRLDEAFADPQVKHRGMAIERDGIPGVASPIVIDGERMVSDRCSPALGS